MRPTWYPPMKHTASTRDRRGGKIKWHGKGFREDGELYIQLKRSYCIGPFSRTHSVNENCTMAEFWEELEWDVKSEEGFPLPEGLSLTFEAFRGKPLNDSQDQVKVHFDGGETVHAKVFDEDGSQWVLNVGAGWEMK